LFFDTIKRPKINNPLFLKQKIRLLKRLHKQLNQKNPGSNQYRKNILSLARMHRKIENQRKNFHFHVANALAKQYNIIVVEDLNLRVIQKYWGRKVSDLGYAQFLKILEWVCLKHGSRMIKIDRYYPSSRICSNCGYKREKLELFKRNWVCPSCNYNHDRDINAAINIERVGASTLNIENVKPASAGCFHRC
jgi:transposase, IS605 OrfB family, central region